MNINLDIAEAHEAAWHLADVATQLLDMGLGMHRTPRDEGVA